MVAMTSFARSAIISASVLLPQALGDDVAAPNTTSTGAAPGSSLMTTDIPTTTTPPWMKHRDCTFTNQPKTNYWWDVSCNTDDADRVGCKADGIHQECRFCGEGDYVACPQCEFNVQPEVNYVWDSACRAGIYTKGCLADGIHFQCRFCGSYEYDPCPTSTATSTTFTSTTMIASSTTLVLTTGVDSADPKTNEVLSASWPSARHVSVLILVAIFMSLQGSVML